MDFSLGDKMVYISIEMYDYMFDDTIEGIINTLKSLQGQIDEDISNAEFHISARTVYDQAYYKIHLNTERPMTESEIKSEKEKVNAREEDKKNQELSYAQSIIDKWKK